MLSAPRIKVVLALAVLALWPAEALAQFWSPWFSRGYRPPSQERRFETLRPFGEGIGSKGKKKTDEAAKAEAPPPDARPVPYDGELSRLSELLGALHYLQPLCGEKDKERWRNEMQDLLNTEQPSADRKDKLTASFNRGYQSYELTYRNCTPSANLAIDRFLGEGAKLAHDIATRYGN
jgi:uncharacterized protein (TIGR02301 family)